MGGRVRDAAYVAGGLVEEAHAAADVAAFRRALLQRLTSFIGADSASLIPMPQPSMLDRRQASALLNIEKHYYSRFADNCARYWRAAPAFVARLVSDGVVIDTDLYSARERERLEPYVEVLIPAGITSILCTPLAFQSRATTLLCLNRHEPGGDPAAHGTPPLTRYEGHQPRRRAHDTVTAVVDPARIAVAAADIDDPLHERKS